MVLTPDLTDKKIGIISHIYTTGPASRLRNYLLKKRVKSLLFIGHPFAYRKDTRSFFKKYRHGKLIKKKKSK